MNLISDVLHIIANISWAADISATIVSAIIGIIWYHPSVFGTTWMGLVGLKPEDMKSVKSKNAMFWNLPITFIIAANIAAFCKHFDYDTPAKAFLIGYDLGLIVCLFLAIHYLYEQRPLTLYGITAGYTIVSMSAMGLVIGMML
jgi:hypothetical protein